MALPLPSGLTPAEVGFLCDMEMVTVIPRQRLESLELLGGPTQALVTPFPSTLPLWLAILLKRQQRANIQPPAWLNADSLRQVLDIETQKETADVLAPAPDLPAASTASGSAAYLDHETLELSDPFLKDSSTAAAQNDALPYHWLELSHILLSNASDDFEDVESVKTLLRDLRDVRMSKLRRGFKQLGSGAGLKINGVGAMEIAEVRGFVGEVIDGLRKIGKSKEETRREREAEQGDDRGLNYGNDDDDDDMQL